MWRPTGRSSRRVVETLQELLWLPLLYKQIYHCNAAFGPLGYFIFKQEAGGDERKTGIPTYCDTLRTLTGAHIRLDPPGHAAPVCLRTWIASAYRERSSAKMQVPEYIRLADSACGGDFDGRAVQAKSGQGVVRPATRVRTR